MLRLDYCSCDYYCLLVCKYPILHIDQKAVNHPILMSDEIYLFLKNFIFDEISDSSSVMFAATLSRPCLWTNM